MDIMRNQCSTTIQQRGRHCWGFGGESLASGGKWGVGTEPPAANGFLRFSREKHSFQHTFSSKKDTPVPAVSAVTIIVSDNTKIFQ